jgi:hypothetical protein
MNPDTKLIFIGVYALLFGFGLIGAYKNIRLINGMDAPDTITLFGKDFDTVNGKTSMHITMSLWILLLICSASMVVYTVISYNLDLVSPEAVELKEILKATKHLKN